MSHRAVRAIEFMLGSLASWGVCVPKTLGYQPSLGSYLSLLPSYLVLALSLLPVFECFEFLSILFKNLCLFYLVPLHSHGSQKLFMSCPKKI